MGLVSCAWFLWTELKLKLAIGRMDSEGLWKHALRPLLLSVMFLLWCLLCWSLLCYTASSVLCPLLFYFGACCVSYKLICSVGNTMDFERYGEGMEGRGDGVRELEKGCERCRKWRREAWTPVVHSSNTN